MLFYDCERFQYITCKTPDKLKIDKNGHLI